MQHTKIRSMVIIGLNSAILCILGPLSLPIGPVPISLTNLVIYFSLYLLGAKQGTLSYLIYVLLGACRTSCILRIFRRSWKTSRPYWGLYHWFFLSLHPLGQMD